MVARGARLRLGEPATREDRVDVHDRLAELRRTVEGARSRPMSTAVVLDRGELLRLVDSVTEALDAALADSQRVLSERDTVLADAQAERERLLADSDVLRDARTQADRLVADARAEADALRRESDDYVDAKLANFEITLQRTAEAVSRGRAKLAGESAFAGITQEAVDQVTLPEHLEG
jgi:cell division septum initiation protein DivIVA